MTALIPSQKLTADQAIAALPTQAVPPVSEAEMQAAVRTLLLGMGEDPDREGLRDTPKRVRPSYDTFSNQGNSCLAKLSWNPFKNHIVN